MLVSTAENLNLFQWNEHNCDINSNNVETIHENFKIHRFCKVIKQHFQYHNTFTFRYVTVDEVKKVTHDLKNNKAAGGEIPVRIFKKCGCIINILKIALIIQLKLPIFLIV